MAGHSKWSEIKRQKGATLQRETYAATAQRDGRFWLVSVPGVRGVRTQVRRLEEAEEAIRGAVALWFEVPADSFEVTVTAVLSDP